MTVEWSARPVLRNPALITAFEGWNDAANAASHALEWMLRRYPAVEFATLDPEDWYDFQAARPRVDVVDGVVRSVTWPRTELYSARVAGAERDLILMRGGEPNLRWPNFCDEVLDVATTLGATMVVTLGALLADTPHTRPTIVTGMSDDPNLAAELGLRRSQYEGPTGVVGTLHDRCRARGLASISLWAPVPHYVAGPPNPKAQLALLERLSVLLSLPASLGALEDAAQEWEYRINNAAQGDDEIATYVANLEASYDTALDLSDGSDPWGVGWTDDLAIESEDDNEIDWDDDDVEELSEWIADEHESLLPTGDDIAADIEEFLRDHGEDPK